MITAFDQGILTGRFVGLIHSVYKRILNLVAAGLDDADIAKVLA